MGSIQNFQIGICCFSAKHTILRSKSKDYYTLHYYTLHYYTLHYYTLHYYTLHYYTKTLKHLFGRIILNI